MLRPRSATRGLRRAGRDALTAAAHRSLAGAALCLLLAAASGQTPPTHQHSFAGAAHWAQVFDDPARDAWQKPHQVIEALGLRDGAVIADLGAGTGYFTVRLAHMLPASRIYAVDVEPQMVDYLARRAERGRLDHVKAILAKADDPLLPEPVDLVLLVDTYHHLADRREYFLRLSRYLKPGGAIAVIDFSQRSPIGPPPAERLAPDIVTREMARSGFELQAEHDFLPNQYFLVFRQGHNPR